MYRKREKNTLVIAKRLAPLIMVLLLMPMLAFATPIYLIAMQIQPSATKSIVTFSLNKKTQGKVKYLADKKQLIVTFENTLKRFDIQNAKLIGSNIETISSTINGKSVVITINLNQKIKWKKYFSVEKSKAILKVEIISTMSTKTKVTKIKVRPFTIVIDAGHGGHDTGAIGPDGIREKNVVLGIAKRLADIINRSGKMRAVLTRSGDYYVNLRQRLKLARKGDADLFIAIHADAHFNKRANGVSIYALSQHGATTEAARWLAQKENYSEIGDVEFNALQDRSAILRSVLIDMSQTVTNQDSERLGTNLLKSLDDVTRLHYKKVERAPFVVLKSPDIPSVLIETGFISNPIEEKKLNNPTYQQVLARAIYNGLKKY